MTDDPPDLIPDDRELDVEVARKVFGFRWVRWSDRTAGADGYRNGRFVALPDRVAASHQRPTEEFLSPGPTWDPFVPAYSRCVGAVLDALPDAAEVDR